LFIRFKS